MSGIKYLSIQVAFYLTASLLIVLFLFPEPQSLWAFVKLVVSMAILLVAGMFMLVIIFEGFADAIKDLFGKKSGHTIDPTDIEELTIQHAINPDHPSLEPYKKAFKGAYQDGLERENERLEEENKKLKDAINETTEIGDKDV